MLYGTILKPLCVGWHLKTWSVTARSREFVMIIFKPKQCETDILISSKYNPRSTNGKLLGFAMSMHSLCARAFVFVGLSICQT